MQTQSVIAYSLMGLIALATVAFVVWIIRRRQARREGQTDRARD
jgi:hypothetical protein